MRVFPYVLFLLIGAGIEALIGNDVGICFIIFTYISTIIVQSSEPDPERKPKRTK